MDGQAHSAPRPPARRRRTARRAVAPVPPSCSPAPSSPAPPADLPERAAEAELVLLAAVDDAGLDPVLAEALEVARELARRSIAENTERTYKSHLAMWDAWCEEHGYRSLPPDPRHVMAHLVDITCRYEDGKVLRDEDGYPVAGDVRAVTASSRLAALNRVCEVNGLPRPGDDPTVATLIAAIRRIFTTATVNAKAALDLPLVRQLLAANWQAADAQLRDRALLVAADRLTDRPGPLARLDWGEVRFSDTAVEVLVPEPSRAKQRRLVRLRATGRADCPLRALGDWHERCGRPESGPVFAMTRQGITKVLRAWTGTATTASAVGQVMAPTARQVRNHALILTIWHAALRRSNGVALDWGDLTDMGDDIRAALRRSKNDQHGDGFVNWLPKLSDENADVCPVRALRHWRRVVAAATGALPVGRVPVFVPIDRHGNLERGPSGRLVRLSGDAVAEIVKELAAKAGLDPDEVAAHSLRSGWITEAAQQGKNALEVQAVSHHKRPDSLSPYCKPVDLRQHNPARQILETRTPPEPEPTPPPPISFAQRIRRRQ